MPDYRYSIARFFADPIRDEPINVGLIVHSSAEQYLGYKFDLRRASHKLAAADKETLKNFQRGLEPIENETEDWGHAAFEKFRVADPHFLDHIADSIGNRIQFTAPRGFSSQDPDHTLEDLFTRFVYGVGRRAPARVTKRTLLRDAKSALVSRGWGDYVKSRPTVSGEHKSYTFPLGIRHSHRTYIEALKLGESEERNFREMAAIGRLWQDARAVPTNRNADLCVILQYSDGHIPAGEKLLKDDGVRVFKSAPQIAQVVDFERVRTWE